MRSSREDAFAVDLSVALQDSIDYRNSLTFLQNVYFVRSLHALLVHRLRRLGSQFQGHGVQSSACTIVWKGFDLDADVKVE